MSASGATCIAGRKSKQERSFYDACALIGTISPKAAEIRASKDLTEAGKKKEVRAWLQASIPPQLATIQGRAALQERVKAVLSDPRRAGGFASGSTSLIRAARASRRPVVLS